jgi:hypothetical protein
MTSQYGTEQKVFIDKTRALVTADPKVFFSCHDWRNVIPKGGRFDSMLLNSSAKKKTRVEAFYVKPLAIWVPHLLFNNHVPTCPHCKKSDYVDVTKGRWINSPKILFGLHRHKYFDTWLYHCRSCWKHFAGYNKVSMQMDAAVYYGFFNFYVGHGYAVDEELYRHVVLESTLESTTTIAKRLDSFANDAYFADYQLYLSAVGMGKIDTHPCKASQQTLDRFCVPREHNNEMRHWMSQKAHCYNKLQQKKLAWSAAKNQCDGDLKFVDMIPSKDNHNVHGSYNILPGLGLTKLRRLVSVGIYSTKALLRANPTLYPSIKKLLPGWKSKCKALYDGYEANLALCAHELLQAENNYNEAEETLAKYLEENPIEEPVEPEVTTGANHLEEVQDLLICRAPLFSATKNKKGYNARVFSKHRVDCLVTTVFNHRKVFMESKMMCEVSELLKIDFNYKLASKVKVWTGQGKMFSPFKCIITIQNEDGLTVFWKALKHSESFSEIQPDLKRLNARLNQNLALKKAQGKREAREDLATQRAAVGLDSETESEESSDDENATEEEAVKVVYVDNCCSVRNIVSECFPGASKHVKLNAFHWLKRWNDILANPGKDHGGVFRALMCRALFNVECTEYAAAKEKLQKKKKQEPSVKEILRERQRPSFHCWV